MTVYFLWTDLRIYNDYVVGVFSTVEKARAARDRDLTSAKKVSADYTIEAREVDGDRKWIVE